MGDVMSLAVKYRPKSFSDMVGQEVAVKILQGGIKKKRSRVFILAGTRGSGKTTLARLIAKAFNNDESNSDIHELDGASNNKVEIIENSIIPFINSHPMTSPYRILIIDECHMLSKSSWAVLLKPLEELPEKTVVVFCTTDPQKIPAAIATRSIKTSLRNIPADLIKKRLDYIIKEENIQATSEALSILAREAKGSLREGITSLEAANMYSDSINTNNVWDILGGVSYTLRDNFLKALLNNDHNRVINILQTVSDKLYFFNAVLEYLTGLIVSVYTETASEWSRDDLGFLQFLLKKMLNLQLKFSGSDLDLTVLIDAFFLATLEWVSKETKNEEKKEESYVGIETILDTVGFIRVW